MNDTKRNMLLAALKLFDLGWLLVAYIAATVLVVLGVGLAVSGVLGHGRSAFAAVTPPGQIPTGSVTILATPRPETAGIRAGDILEVNPGVLAGGLMVAPMPDGKFQVVDGAADLPANVINALKNDAIAALGGAIGEPLAVGERTTAFEQYADYAHATTGRWPVVVAKDADSAGSWSFWGHDRAGTEHSPAATFELASSSADDWVRARPGGPFVVLKVGA